MAEQPGGPEPRDWDEFMEEFSETPLGKALGMRYEMDAEAEKQRKARVMCHLCSGVMISIGAMWVSTGLPFTVPRTVFICPRCDRATDADDIVRPLA